MSTSSSGSSDPGPEPPPPQEASGAYRTGSVVLFGAQPAFRENARTMLPSAAFGSNAAKTDFRALFLGAYEGMRRVALSRREVGLAAFAIDRLSGALAASMTLAGRPGRAIGAIVGRHEVADLRLTEDAWLANRQLAVIVHPLTSWEPDRLRYSVLDLRTHHPMVGEQEHPLASALVEGPFFARVGRFALYFLPTGDASDFPEDAEDAWTQLPARVVLESGLPERDGRREQAARQIALSALDAARPAGRSGTRNSVITSMGPLLAPDDRLLKSHERKLGELTLRTHASTVTYGVGADALDRGILLGRYPRCDGAGVLSYDRISRAHLLIKRVDGHVVALDTSSTNGSYLHEPALLRGRFRLVPLGAAARIELADVAELRWTATPG